MSVLMVMSMPADGGAVEAAVNEHRETFLAISESAKGHGCIHHDFYMGDGELVVVDEWDSPESFQAFMEAEGANIGKVMDASGIREQPTARIYKKMELGDSF